MRPLVQQTLDVLIAEEVWDVSGAVVVGIVREVRGSVERGGRKEGRKEGKEAC